MMTSLAQNYSPHPGGMQPHPGMAQGHPMVPHNPGQPGQPGPGMPQQMHMGVSGPGPQVSQGGAMMGMPPGAPSQHALQHLNPNQQQAQHMFQQQQMAFANPMQQLQQQQIMHQRQQQAARQQMLAQQYSGMPVQMTNGMNPMTQAQIQAMRGNPMARPVNLPQHLQQQQQQVAEHSMQQQQQQQAAQAQHQHQQQLMMAQHQMAMQQQAANAQNQAGNNPQGQPGQMNPQQPQNMQAAQTAAMMQQHHQQQQQQQHAAHALSQAAQQAAQGQAQPPPQQGQPNAQAQGQQPQPAPQQQANLQQQQVIAAAMMQQQQQRQGEKFKGQCLMKLMQFGDHLSNFGMASKPLASYMANGMQRLAAQASKQREDLNYWHNFVDRFFSPKGVFRHSLWFSDETSNKQYEITYPALPRYFQTHFESGVKNMQMIMEKGSEKELPSNGHYIESQKSSFVYWFENGSQLIASGTLKAHFDAEQKIELLEFVTSNHEEYLPRNQIVNAARPLHEWSKEWRSLNAPPDGKQSPELNKKKAKPMKSPNQAPPEIDIPESLVLKMGITASVFRFLEIAEVMGQMNPLFNYSHQNSSLSPIAALDQYVSIIASNGTDGSGGQQPNPTGPRTPGMGNFPMGVSPAQAHLQLPDGSPRVSGSPAQAPNMQLQQSQHGTSSSGPSANTSPNASNKRRRPSVKDEVDVQVNGNPSKTAVKPSPRIGGKRQKGNPA